MKNKNIMIKIINNIKYKFYSFILKRILILYSDDYVDQFTTLKTTGKYGNIYIRIDRSLPDSEIKDSIEL